MTTPATLLTAARDALVRILVEDHGRDSDWLWICDECKATDDEREHHITHKPTCLIAQLDAALAVPCAGCGCPPHAPNECPTMLQVNETRRRVRCRCDHGAALAVPAVEWHSDGDAGAWADFGMFLLTIERTHDRAGFFWNLHVAGEEPSGYCDTLDAAKAAAERAAGVK